MGAAQRAELRWPAVGREVRGPSTLRVNPPTWPGEPLRLSGEADVSTESVLRRALNVLQPADGVLVVDLTGLEFIDVGSVSLLVSRAKALDQGERMILQGVRGLVERVLRMLAVERLGPIDVAGPRQAGVSDT